MKIATCTITRLGNKYLKEYVSHYKKIGVDKMYFYDNNQEGEEHVIDALYEEANNGFVEIIEFSDKVGKVQELAYQDFYDKHGKEYDWIGCFDDDEYLTINNESDLKKFLERKVFEGKNIVSFPMINFSDSGLIVNPKSTRLDAYTELSFPENIYGWSFYKSFVRGGLNVRYIEYKDETTGNIYRCCCHVPIVDGKIANKAVDCDGNVIINDYEKGIDAAIVQYIVTQGYIKHFPTGCIDDFIQMKHLRGWPDTNSEMGCGKKNKFDFGYFLRYNKYTEEKYQYYLTHGG